MKGPRERKETRIVHSDKTSNEVSSAWKSSAGEMHLQSYPIFQITTVKPKENRHTYEERIFTKDGAEVVRQWTVEISDLYGWPGQHEAEVWRAIEHIIEERSRQGQLKNPVVTTFAEIRSHMPGSSVGGEQWARIKHSLAVLKNTGVVSSFFYRKQEGIREETQFDILDDFSIILKHDEEGNTIYGDNGEPIMDGVRIRINQYIWANIEHRYVRPIDRGYRAELKRWSSRRLYEILAGRFFARRNKDGLVKLRYSQVCGLLGAKRQRYLSKAKQIMSRYHTELREMNPPFINAVEWHPKNSDQNDWLLVYHPGPKAKAEWDQQHWWREHKSEPLFIEGDLDDESSFSRDPVWVEGEIDVEVSVASDYDERQDYRNRAKEIFATRTGTKRRWDQKDRKLLKTLQQEGITLDDIEAGIKNCLAEREEAAAQESLYRRSVPSLDPIRTLRYCEAHIWEANRQRHQQQKRGHEAAKKAAQARRQQRRYEEAKANQPVSLKMLQERIHEQFQGHRQRYDNELADLLLIEVQKNGTHVFLLPSRSQADRLREFYPLLIQNAVGGPIRLLPNSDKE